MSRLQSGAPLLASHDSQSLDSVIGVVERAWLDNGQGKAVVRFSTDEQSNKIYEKVKTGILRNVSIGYEVRKYQSVGNKEDKIPTYRAVDYSIAEISIVPIGFDQKAQVRNNSNKFNEVEIIDSTNKEKMENNNEKKSETLQERSRAKEIRQAVRSAKFDESYADELIEQNLTSDQARKMVLEKLAAQQPPTINNTTRVEIGFGENDGHRKRALESALLHRMDAKNFKVEENSKHLFGRSLLSQIESVIPRHTMESDVSYAARSMSSSDLPLIIANVAEKSMQTAYGLAPKSYSLWAGRQSVRNYKEHSFHALSDFPSLVERPEGSEFTYGYVSEKQEKAQVVDYGRILSFSSKLLVNDDLSSLQKLSSGSGIAAARLDNQLVYSALTTNKVMADSVALYHNSHGNLAASGAAISDTTIDLAFKAIMAQKSVGDLDNLNLVPKWLICGPANMVAAKKALAAINATTSADVNVFSGSLDLVVDSEISGNQYYFVCDNNLIDTVSLIHLEGREAPVFESRVNFMTNSLELKTAYAVAAAPLDWRGLYKNAGA